MPSTLHTDSQVFKALKARGHQSTKTSHRPGPHVVPPSLNQEHWLQIKSIDSRPIDRVIIGMDRFGTLNNPFQRPDLYRPISIGFGWRTKRLYCSRISLETVSGGAKAQHHPQIHKIFPFKGRFRQSKGSMPSIDQIEEPPPGRLMY